MNKMTNIQQIKSLKKFLVSNSLYFDLSRVDFFLMGLIYNTPAFVQVIVWHKQANETAIGNCKLAKILNDSLTVIFIDICILFFVSISAIFSHFLLFSQ